MKHRRRLILAARLRRHGVRRPLLVVNEAVRAGLRVSDAVALLEKETGIPQRNVFGCDHGSCQSVPWCHQEVTRARVEALLNSPYANGVGWTQLTYRPFVFEAHELGGAHRPKWQMRVGFRVLADLQAQRGRQDGFRAYNGSGPAAEAYARHALLLAKTWHERLNPRGKDQT